MTDQHLYLRTVGLEAAAQVRHGRRSDAVTTAFGVVDPRLFGFGLELTSTFPTKFERRIAARYARHYVALDG